MIHWIVKFFKVKPRRRRVIRRASATSRKQYNQYKEAARALVSQRLPQLNQRYRFTYGRVSIRNQSTRWGSCSKQGNLNFNYKIVLLPVHLQDYIMVHELCHLKELNHSSAFWKLVAQAIPDYKLYRRTLRSRSLSSVTAGYVQTSQDIV